MDISFIIVNWNTKKLLLNCLESIYQTVKNFRFEVFVVDNGSVDGSVDAVKQNFPSVQLIINKDNIGFARAANQGLKLMSGRYAVLLNTDTILKEGAIEQLISFMNETPQAGICGGQLLNEDNSKQNSFDNFPSLLTLIVNKFFLGLIFPRKFPTKNKNYTKPIEVDSVIGACLVARKEAIDDVGLLDEDYFFFLEETDWCFRMQKKGWKVYFVPRTSIIHLQGKTAERTPVESRIHFYRSRYLFFRKHKGRLVLPLVKFIVVIKLIFNIILNYLGCIMGLKQHSKLTVYNALLFWHLKGCPDDIKFKQNSFITRDGLKLTINSQYYQAFLASDVENLVQLIKQQKGKIIQNRDRATVFSLDLKQEGLPEKIIVKRYKLDDLWWVLRLLFKSSRARRSWYVSWKFLEEGINVPVPLIWGEKRAYRFLQESFIITEEISAVNLGTYIKQFKPPISPEKIKLKEQLITDFALILRDVHDRGFFSDDLNVSNILIKKEENKTIFWFVDLDASECKKHLSVKKRVKNLLRLNKSLKRALSGVISQQDKLEFLQEYAGEDTDFFGALVNRLNKSCSYEK